MPETEEEIRKIMTVKSSQVDDLGVSKERIEQIAYDEGRKSAEKSLLETGTDVLEKRNPGLFIGYYIQPLQHSSLTEPLISNELYDYWIERDKANLVGQDYRVKQWLSGWCQQMDYERVEQLKTLEALKSQSDTAT